MKRKINEPKTEKMWASVLDKSKIRYLKETDGKLVTFVIDAGQSGTKFYQFSKGKCIGQDEDLNNGFSYYIDLFTKAFQICPYTNLEIHGGNPVFCTL